ncbi:MAG TPA: FAD-binding protein [Candidatus Binatia bacterium]|jgi:2-polyprenyl-6-methoxyphenol hydroxylase-like FAD-dependent oxidoreductase|nr:FAD-binding protein [Candidatus Binatia bacterium]
MSTRHAVVLGGSMAGLCAARVLADHAEHVTVVERDVFPIDVADRAGVPQSRHPHALLVRGRRELERWFPGFDAGMVAGGALELDFLRDFAAYRETGWWKPMESGVRTLFASRALMESVVRDLLRTNPRVTLRDRTEAQGFVADTSGAVPRVTGVRVAARDGGATEALTADLVVDASGRSARTPEWLRALGVEPPEETIVDARAAYSTRWYRIPAERPADWWWRGIWIDPKDLPHDRAGVLMPIEGDRWIVALGGLGGNYPPTDDAGFDAALRALRSPLIADVVARAEPISPVYGNREMANRFRHYDRWTARVDGFVALGDAACKFNPIHGQGMTSAAVCAGILHETIARTGLASPELPRAFFTAQARFLRDPWTLATGADFRVPGTTGPRPPFTGLVARYMDAMLRAMADDGALRTTLAEVIHMLRPASALFAPGVVARVARHAWRSRGASRLAAALDAVQA